uniref:Uncharacterized protein n=1 Tax=Strigamia maritima TaxID=126957 RepID=T1JP50_STRMM
MKTINSSSHQYLSIIIFLFQYVISSISASNSAVQLFHGYVGGGNYSYYKLTLDGVLLLTLKSIEGDADLYISQNNLYPTFDVDEHALQSTTCGLDKVRIPRDLMRPVGIGVYGHPASDISKYELQVHWIDDDNQDRFVNINDYDDIQKADHNKPEAPLPAIGKDDDESILWTILVGILKVVLEILAS